MFYYIKVKISLHAEYVFFFFLTNPFEFAGLIRESKRLSRIKRLKRRLTPFELLCSLPYDYNNVNN